MARQKALLGPISVVAINVSAASTPCRPEPIAAYTFAGPVVEIIFDEAVLTLATGY